jgi:hypothetical protein
MKGKVKLNLSQLILYGKKYLIHIITYTKTNSSYKYSKVKITHR